MKNRYGVIYLRATGHSLLFVLVFLAIYSDAFAQPAWSRGEQRFQINFQEGMNRADAALRAEGYVNIGMQANMVYGYKGENSAVITCNEGTNGYYWINIFVASLTNNHGVPGAERVKLQGRMGNSNYITPPDLSGIWYHYSESMGSAGAVSKIFQNGDKLTFVNEFNSQSEGYFINSTTVKATSWANGLEATLEDNGRRIVWKNGSVWLRSKR
jgi:hypothetical protein